MAFSFSNTRCVTSIFLAIAILFISVPCLSHPGIGIVKDSKGNIYYSDLVHVWRISNQQKRIVVPDVHTHELYIDPLDNLFGEGSRYDEITKKFYHYLWVYRPDGRMDTVVGMKEAYITLDFSLARDKKGNEYYTTQYLLKGDTTSIYKRTPDGREIIFATGQFKGVKWLHPQDNGTVLYTLGNSVYEIDTNGEVSVIADNVGNHDPSFEFSENNITLWGVWKDNSDNIYVAVFSDQAVRRIDTAGNRVDVYISKDNWTPLYGVFDNENKLWVLETSDKNEIRVIPVEEGRGSQPFFVSTKTIFLIIAIAILVVVFYMNRKHVSRRIVD